MSSSNDWDHDPGGLSAGLTESQATAVEHFEGPLLVLAGPGSGKTRVITRRIARLVERGVRPWEILAITFTNKASREMADRVNALLPGKRVWVSTFHRFCSRVLREYGEGIGLRPNFSIFDVSDQHSLLRQIISDEGFDSKHFSAARIGSRISAAKNELISPADYARVAKERVGTHIEAVVAKVYPQYQQRLLEANAVDFDDLLVHVANLLTDNAELRNSLDERYRFILVDEYQDTNRPQYQIVRALSQTHPNLCVTGDPDQSIYAWRGAQIENILRFERDYPLTKIIRLEENFRSTPEILQVADNLIANNTRRKAKRLKPTCPSGADVELRLYEDGVDESAQIAAEIECEVSSGRRKYSDYAIFYRVNSLSRSLEIALARLRIAHQVTQGVAFYERTEVKDLLCYLRLIENGDDTAAFARVVNTPTRGIGKSSLTKLGQFAAGQRITPLEAAHKARSIPGLPKKAAESLVRFAQMIETLVPYSAGPVAELLEKVVVETNYRASLDDSGSEDELQRLSNVDELVASAAQYDQLEESPSLGGFLESASLAMDSDKIDPEAGSVTLMTLHAAKGLEFPCVYVVGIEQGLLPHDRSMQTGELKDLEEERRLLFVGVTRAKEQLVLTHCRVRATHGRVLSSIRSLFLDEMGIREQSRIANNGWGSLGWGTARDGVSSESDPDAAIYENWGADAGDIHSAADRAAADDSNDAADDEWDEANPFLDRKAGPALRPKAKPPAVSRASAAARPALANPLDAVKQRMITGADLLKSPGDNPTQFVVGMLVRHPRYGRGEVLELSTIANRPSVTVQFEDEGRVEQFIASKCPLQPIGGR